MCDTSALPRNTLAAFAGQGPEATRPAAAAAASPQPPALLAADCQSAQSPLPGAPALTEQWWPWPLVSALFHGLVIVAAVLLGGLAFGPPEEPPFLVIGTMDLAGLGGGGPAGGDGLESGKGGAAPRGAVEDGARASLRPEPEAAAASPAPAPPEQEQATAPEPAPEPEPIPVPSLDAATQPPPKPALASKPTPPPKPRPRQAPEAPKTRQATSKSVAPAGQAQMTQTVETTDARSGEGTGDGPGRGLVGEGTGKGPAQGAGPGGNGDGSGGTGSGLAEENFGQGDGPKFRHRCLPRYPDAAKRSGQEGRVRLKLTIDAEGLLRNVSVVEHTGLEFVEEALRAIQGSTFLPAVHQGRPVACHALLTIHFKLG